MGLPYREPKGDEISPQDLGAQRRGGDGVSGTLSLGVGVIGEGIKRWGIEGIRTGTSDRFGRGRGEFKWGFARICKLFPHFFGYFGSRLGNTNPSICRPTRSVQSWPKSWRRQNLLQGAFPV